ncbi:TonB-dependent receptor [Bacteroides sp. UBA939]|uniref:TonB-dependent receptor n=1 Tax=Bacteroides sp. UBA939 TaxID=1946092 RepID=UPI0025B895F3|nr:TonB-dependent receptor [Bacteroides sp. UBA939]
MRQKNQIRRRHDLLLGLFLLLVMHAVVFIHAGTPFIEREVLFKDTLKNENVVSHPSEEGNISVIRNSAPARTDGDPLLIVNKLEIPPEIFAALNPDYIRSIEILKDASATAVYGERGANGVIIITLKSAEQVKRENATRKIDALLKPRGVDKRNVRYYIDGKEAPASTAYQTDIEQMDVKTGADGILEVYIKPIISVRGEYE